MPIFRLTDDIQFPPVDLAEDSGLLAVGGDLTSERLLCAYRDGIFPWFSIGDPLLWWFTSPRLVLFPKEFHIPKRVARYQRNCNFTITKDTAFAAVIQQCATIRTESGEDTWIIEEMKNAYEELHRLGYAHSVECWQNDTLVGGLYGVALGKVFFGESMFSRIRCGSQFALIALMKYLEKENYQMIDCQMTTNHLLRFGAREITGGAFHKLLKLHIPDILPQEHWYSDEKNTNRPLQPLRQEQETHLIK
ncbi:MAG: leucyl/phenylalanyl-tRNA--protein transferase [Desulfotalea sp.]|nr:MAG: leucyl/phenylalanyl-tRNA--protein transferase [Desulfotalea sp.]